MANKLPDDVKKLAEAKCAEPPAFRDTRPRHSMDQPKREGVCVCSGHENKHPALDRSLRVGQKSLARAKAGAVRFAKYKIPATISAIADAIRWGRTDNVGD
jgi:hypothetical protein